MTQIPEHDIPLLTDIIQPGDADMSRHFDTTVSQNGISAEKVEQLVNELLDEMLPAFKQQLMARLLEKINT